MPTIAIVDGVKIQFYANEHPPAHFHIAFAEYRAQVEIKSLRIIKGRFPPAKFAVVVNWAQSRREALLSAWHTTIAQRSPGKIK